MPFAGTPILSFMWALALKGEASIPKSRAAHSIGWLCLLAKADSLYN